MSIRNNAKKFLGIAVVLSVLSIWSIAQTSQTDAEALKAEAEIALTQGKNAQSLTNSQLLSSAGTIIATNNGVTITQGPGASIPEGPEPQEGSNAHSIRILLILMFSPLVHFMSRGGK